ncbi:kinase-like domain-containing protein [Syncephalis plumigaleata]|nr:kinase-like domain-containing protein [Syncephalis plumigaleata]
MAEVNVLKQLQAYNGQFNDGKEYITDLLFDFGIGFPNYRILEWWKKHGPTELVKSYKPKPGHCAVIKYAGKNDLKKYVKGLSIYQKKFELPVIGFQLLKALRTLHAAGIVHGDVKPENVMINKDANGNVKATLIDFDGSILIQPGQSHRGMHIGYTFEYMPPELSILKYHNLYKVDTWLLAGTLYYCIAGKGPIEKLFPEDLRTHRLRILGQIAYRYYRGKFNIPLVTSDKNEAKILELTIALMDKLMIANPAKRDTPEGFLARYPDLQTFARSLPSQPSLAQVAPHPNLSRPPLTRTPTWS